MEVVGSKISKTYKTVLRDFLKLPRVWESVGCVCFSGRVGKVWYSVASLCLTMLVMLPCLF